MRAFLFLIPALALACADEPADPPAEAVPDDSEHGTKRDGKGDGTWGGVVYSSMSTIEALEGDLGSVSPSVQRIYVGDPLPPKTYLKAMSCLGYYGPVGPYGPLGLLGPVGEAIFNPSRYVTGAVDWNLWAQMLEANEGPLTADGPLGADGPLNTALWPKLGEEATASFEADRTFSEDFIAQLGPGGVWSVLGPVGPLGALGPLGPLGPIGAHGYRADEDGHYRAEEGDCLGGDVCRAVGVEWTAGGEVRTWPLFEQYPEKVAAALPDNDTSFMAIGSIERPSDGRDQFEFTSADDQWVTVLVVPHYARFTWAEAMTILFEAAFIGFETPAALPFFPWVYGHRSNFDDFDLVVEVTGEDGETLGWGYSNSADRADWVQMKVPAGSRLRASVELYRAWWQPWRFVDPEYRLIVVGSTPYVDTFPVVGDHRRDLEAE